MAHGILLRRSAATGERIPQGVGPRDPPRFTRPGDKPRGYFFDFSHLLSADWEIPSSRAAMD